MYSQVYLPSQWIQLFKHLDTLQKSWNFIIESSPRNYIHYRFQFSYRSMNNTWTINFTIQWKNQERTIRLSFKESENFYNMFLFCLIRIPKQNFLISMLNSGKTIIVEHKMGWSKDSIELAKKNLKIDSVIGTTNLNFSLESNFITDFLNSTSKKDFFQENNQ